MKKLLNLFWEFFKIGLFTFGGGYAMVAVIERTLVEKKGWITQEEFMDVIAIAESTPGPIAINSASYIGYKIKGVFGSVFATLGVVLPSLTIVYIISLVFEWFLGLEYVGYAFKGIQACVAFLIISAGIKMLKPLKKNAFNIIVLSVVIIGMVLIDLFAVNFSTIYIILAGGVLGIIVYYTTLARNKFTKKSADKEGERIAVPNDLPAENNAESQSQESIAENSRKKENE